MIWAIGDVHGLYDPLSRLLDEMRLLEDPADPIEKLILIGDYIDHGPSSKGVMDLLRRLDLPNVLLMGNHEDMAIRFVKADKAYSAVVGNNWFHNGAVDTYVSFCEDPKSLPAARRMVDLIARGRHFMDEEIPYAGLEIPNLYKKFLYSLKYSHREILNVGGRGAGFTFLHALPYPKLPMDAQRPVGASDFERHLMDLAREAYPNLDDLSHHRRRILSRAVIDRSVVWGRDYNLKDGYGGDVVVHGHTPTPYYPEHFRLLASLDPKLGAQFATYPVKSLPPFLFSRSPGARYESGEWGDAREGFKTIGLHEAWLDLKPEFLRYRTYPEMGVEAVNIDTGAVTGGALTALGLS